MKQVKYDNETIANAKREMSYFISNSNYTQISMQPLIIYIHYETNDVECSYFYIKYLYCQMIVMG